MLRVIRISKNCFYIIKILILCAIIACSTNRESEFVRLDNEGNKHFSDNKYSEAVQIWEKALSINGEAKELYEKIGIAYYRMTELMKAQSYLKIAIEKNPVNYTAMRQLGKIRLLYGDFTEAEKIWETIQSGGKVNSDDYVYYGDILELQGRIRDAEHAYQKALTMDPENHLGEIQLAVNLLTQNRVTEADNLFEMLDSANPTNPDVMIKMATYCRLSGRLDQAEKYFTGVMTIEPDVVNHRLDLAEIYISRSQTKKAVEVLKPITANRKMSRLAKKMLADMLMSLNQIADAECLLSDLSTENKDDVDLLMLRGKLNLLTRKPAIAVLEYQAAIDMTPQNAQAHYWLGISYIIGGHKRLGLQSLVKALSINNDYSDAEIAIADYYLNEGNFKLAFEYASRVTEKHRDSFRGYMVKGNICFAQKNYNAAIRIFQSALALSPESTQARFFLAFAMENSGKIEDALNLYKQILAENPLLADVSRRYAGLLVKEKEISQAIEYFEEKAQNNSEHGYFYCILGDLYLANSDTDKAINTFHKAITATPQLSLPYKKLSQIYEKNKQIQMQMNILKKAIESIPRFTYAYNKLGSIYLQEGRYEDAVDLLESAYEKDPDNPFLANNLAILYLDQDMNPIKAFKLAQFAYEKMPEYQPFSDTIGWAYCKRGIYNSAIWYLNAALNKNSLQHAENNIDSESGREVQSSRFGEASIHYHMGFALFNSGQVKKAKRHLEIALSGLLSDKNKASAEMLLSKIDSAID